VLLLARLDALGVPVALAEAIGAEAVAPGHGALGSR
jgi:hypothetical protein